MNGRSGRPAVTEVPPMSPGLFALLAVVSQTPAPAPEPLALPPPTQFQTRIDDPMLAPMPPEAQRVASWREALTLMQQRSTDLRSAQAGVARAEGRWRQALSL